MSTENDSGSYELNQFFDKALGMLCIAGFDGYFKVLNPSWITTLGFSDMELKAKPFIDFVHPDDREATQAAAAALVAGESVVSFENRYLCKDGSYKWFHWTTSVSVEKALTYAIAVDITAKKAVEAEQKRLVLMLDGLINNSDIVITVKDTQGKYLLANPTFLRIVQLTNDEIIGKTDPEVFPGERGEGFWEADQQVLRTGELTKLEQQAIDPDDGTLHTYISTKYLLYDESAQPYAICTLATDITRQKEAEHVRELLQEDIITSQRQAIQELSTPIIPVVDGIIVMPLVGNIDSMRAQDLMRTLLKGISQHRAKIVILDITGVLLIDTGIAAHLDKTIQAARLKGAQTIITGMSDAVAETIIELGIDWSKLETLRDLQTGLMVALHQLNLEIKAVIPD